MRAGVVNSIWSYMEAISKEYQVSGGVPGSQGAAAHGQEYIPPAFPCRHGSPYPCHALQGIQRA